MSQRDFYEDAELQEEWRERLGDKETRRQGASARSYPTLDQHTITAIECFLENPCCETWSDGCSGGGNAARGQYVNKRGGRWGDSETTKGVTWPTDYLTKFTEPDTLWQVCCALGFLDPWTSGGAEDAKGKTIKQCEVPTPAQVITALKHVGALVESPCLPISLSPHLPVSPSPAIWRITSYTALGMNGGDEWEPRFDENDVLLANADRQARREAIPGWKPEYATGIGVEKNGIKCALAPTLSTLVATLFTAVVVDEGVRMKATDAYVARGVRNLRPAYRLVLTATPVKNRLEDIFWLAHWACGGTEEPNARFPYESSDEARERFANEHQVQERNLTKEDAARRAGQRKRFVKRTAQICNIHRLWKLLGPIVIRRRKDDAGTDIAQKLVIPIKVRPCRSQQAVYQYHLTHPPKTVRGGGRPLEGPAQKATQLTLLRQAALCPDTPALKEFGGGPGAASWTSMNSKVATALSLVVEKLGQGQQIILMSPFQHASRVLYERLRESGVSCCLLDGSLSPAKRADLAKMFKRQAFAVMVAGQKAMGEGHSFECCPNLVRMSLDWAFDINDQSGDRVHRITSPDTVRIYDLITENTVDERLADLYHEKGDSANLALDGRLFAERTEEVNLAQLLRDAIDSFDPAAPTIDEQTLEDEWPRLQAKLRHAERQFREWHPPVADILLEPGRGHDRQLSLADLNRALAGLQSGGDAPVAVPPTHAPRVSLPSTGGRQARQGDKETRRQGEGTPLGCSTADDYLAQLIASLDASKAPTSAQLKAKLNRRK